VGGLFDKLIAIVKKGTNRYYDIENKQKYFTTSMWWNSWWHSKRHFPTDLSWGLYYSWSLSIFLKKSYLIFPRSVFFNS
jgi:hypothetical protein